jgi:tryptophanase
MAETKIPVEPYKIKSIEPIHLLSREKREELLRAAGFNVFAVPAPAVFIDLLTDSGTAAMSQKQWAGIMEADEAYSGSRSFDRFQNSVKDIFGFKHVIPTHQGRAAERILFDVMVKQGDSVPNNIHFDTTRANIEHHAAGAFDLVRDNAYDPDDQSPFKGDMDLTKLEAFIKEKRNGRIPLVMMTVTNNSGGGQPVSMANLSEVSRICRKHKIPFFLDACRFAENAYFIQQREPGYSNKSIPEIAREMFACADGATMSAKKDALVNIGGFVTCNDDDLADKLKNNLILGEGFPTYGGLSGRDLEAVAQGLQEGVDAAYLEHRIGQIKYLWSRLRNQGIPVYSPAGGHAVYLLADRFLEHLPREHYPGWALSVALYREAGIRAVEIGGVMFGRTDKETGREIFPQLELVRLAFPRRVYTVSHLEYIAEALARLYEKRDRIKGFRIAEQAPYLRHFTVKMKEIDYRE